MANCSCVRFRLDTNSLDSVWNIGFGENEGLAGDADDALIRTATGGWRQHSRRISDVGANHGKVAAGEFKDVRTTVAADGLCPVGVRVGTEPAKKHGLCIHAGQQSAKRGENARTK